MRILIAGANGQIGRQLIERIADSLHASRAMIRDEDQAETLRELGANATVVADLEDDIDKAVTHCDAVVFTAGSGADTGPEKTEAVDRDGAIALIDAAREAGVSRFVMVSSMGAGQPEDGPEEMQHYLRAKQAADEHLADSGLDYTIVRPGRLTNEAACGRVALDTRLQDHGEVPRADVAAVLLEVLKTPDTIGKTFEVLKGEKPIEQAVSQL